MSADERVQQLEEEVQRLRIELACAERRTAPVKRWLTLDDTAEYFSKSKSWVNLKLKRGGVGLIPWERFGEGGDRMVDRVALDAISDGLSFGARDWAANQLSERAPRRRVGARAAA
jgi:hypothetical protein